MPNSDIDIVALGILGVKEAAFDYVTNANDADSLRFEIRQPDPSQKYNLTFFGSHKYSSDTVTRYSIYTDNSYATLVGSVDLLVGSEGTHNRDQVAVLNNIAPQAANILYVQVDGATIFSGYLNSLAIEAVPRARRSRGPRGRPRVASGRALPPPLNGGLIPGREEGSG